MSIFHSQRKKTTATCKKRSMKKGDLVMGGILAGLMVSTLKSRSGGKGLSLTEVLCVALLGKELCSSVLGPN